jgi:hypothetical protein
MQKWGEIVFSKRQLGMRVYSNDYGVKIVNIATSKNLVVKGTLFPHRDIHK